MKTIKDTLSFCNAALFYDFKNIGFIEELNQARRCIFNNFHETKPVYRRPITLSFVDVVILKVNDGDIENFILNFHDLRENILYMLSSERVIREEEANETD